MHEITFFFQNFEIFGIFMISVIIASYLLLTVLYLRGQIFIKSQFFSFFFQIRPLGVVNRREMALLLIQRTST